MQDCPLLRLPLELREAIYDLTFGFNTPICIGTYSASPTGTRSWPPQPPLARTCTLIRREALSVYYATMSFVLSLQDRKGMEIVLDWLQMTEQSAMTMLRHVSVVVGSGLLERPRVIRLDLRSRKVEGVSRQQPSQYHALDESGMLRGLNVDLDEMQHGEIEIRKWLKDVVKLSGRILDQEEVVLRGFK